MNERKRERERRERERRERERERERVMLRKHNETNERVEGEERKRILSKSVFSSCPGPIRQRLETCKNVRDFSSPNAEVIYSY